MLWPDPQRRGDIHFVFARATPYGRRIVLVVLLLLAGFLTQVLSGLIVAGLPFLLAASLLSVVKGYKNCADPATGKKEWRNGDLAHLQKILTVSRKAKQWDQSALDITCGTGFLVLGALAVAVGLIFLGLCSARQEWLAQAFIADTLVLFLPHWFTGVRRILVDAPLTVKVNVLLGICAAWERIRAGDETLAVQIEVVRSDKGETPVDVKLILQRATLGDGFLGLQTQVVLNNVQGRDYPYAYCVLVAKRALRMPEQLGDSLAEAAQAAPMGWKDKFLGKPPSGIVTSWQRDNDLDILVIRQATSKTSGYHTDTEAVSRLFECALHTARRLTP